MNTNRFMKAISAVAAAAAVFSISHGASAQLLGTPTQNVEKPLSVKLGVFLPTDDNGKTFGGKTQFSVGLDYALEKTAEQAPLIPSVYFDYQGGSDNGGHTNTYGLGIAARTYLSTPSGDNRQGISPYVGAGIGGYDEDISNSYNSDSKVNFGGKVLAGLEFSQAYFVEANYQFLPSVEGVNPSGFGVQVGARF